MGLLVCAASWRHKEVCEQNVSYYIAILAGVME